MRLGHLFGHHQVGKAYIMEEGATEMPEVGWCYLNSVQLARLFSSEIQEH